MTGSAKSPQHSFAGSEKLPPFTRKAPATLGGMWGSYSRIALLAMGDGVLTLVGQGAGVSLGSAVYGTAAAAGWTSGLDDLFPSAGLVISTLTFVALYRGYRDLHRPLFEVIRDVFAAGLGSFVLAAILYFLKPGRSPMEVGLLPGGVITACLLGLWRIPFARYARKAWRERPVTLVSTQPEYWKRHLPPHIPVHNSVPPNAVLHSRSGPERVMVTPDVGVEDRERIISWALRHQVELYLVPDIYEILVASGRPVSLGDMAIFHIRPLALPPELRAVKRLTDLLGACVLLCVFLPMFLIISLLIWMEDRGPVWYRQKRVGRNGRVFDIFKFRTMMPDAERDTGPIWARQEDPRVTRIGRLLRSTRFDELPQLVNVLRGEMSLVGPRPERPELLGKLSICHSMFRARECIRPGITGLAQVLGNYDTPPESKLRLDLLYTTRWSPWLDLAILLWTVPLMLVPGSVGRAAQQMISRFGRRRFRAHKHVLPDPNGPQDDLGTA